MNKVTLSLVALATMGGAAQAQNADLTEEQIAEKIASKQAAIDELRIQLNKATNNINDNCKDVKSDYLLQLSGLEAELNEIYNDSKILEFTAEQSGEYATKINNVVDEAKNAQKPYDVKVELDNVYEALKAKYDAAIAETQSYPNVGAARKYSLEQIGVELIGEKIAAFDLTKSDIVAAEGNIKADINAATKEITTLMEGIAEDESNAANNETSYESVKKAYDEAKTLYDEQLSSAIKLLPTPIYADWQKAAIDELNKQYRILNSAYKDNETAYANEKAHENAAVNLANIAGAKAQFETVVRAYADKVEVQETALSEVNERVKSMQVELDAIKDELKQSEITSCDDAVSNVQTLIDKTKAEIEDAYEKHTVNEYQVNGYVKAESKITAAKNNIKDANGNTYTELIKNKASYKAMVSDLTALKAKVTEAETKAKTQSDDKKYNAAEHFTASLASLNKSVADLDKKVESWNSAKNPTCYSKATTFNYEKEKIEESINAYSASTANSLSYYNAAIANADKAQTALDALVKEATDTSVTTDEQGVVTYQSLIDGYKNGIADINKAIASANKKTDANHESEMQKASKKSVDVEAIDAYTVNYKTYKDTYDLNTANKAASSHIASATTRINDIKSKINAIAEDLYGDKFNAEVKTKKDGFATKLSEIETKFTAAKNEYDPNTLNLNAVAKVIAEFSKVDAELDALNNGTETETGLEAFLDEVIALEANYDSKVALDAKINEADTKIDKMRINLACKTTDACDFYDNKFSALKIDLINLKDNVEKSYEKKTALADKEGYEKEVEAILATAKLYEDAVIPNETAYKSQNAKAEKLQATWQKAYDTVANGDLSDKAKDYLSELAQEQEKINTLNKDITSAHKVGQSVAKQDTFDATIAEIEAALEKIQSESVTNYDENVKNTNATQHNAFLETSKQAEKAFTDAVETLNAYAKIENSAGQTAVENLLTTHDAIYAYADKIRSLSKEENDKYLTYKAAEYGEEECIYNSTEYQTKAIAYKTEINELIKQYQSKVDAEAENEFSQIVANAQAKLAEYQAKVAGYVYDKGKATAFKDIAAVVTKAAAATPENSVRYAVKIDEWWNQLDGNLTKTLDEALVAACDAEKDCLVKDINKVYTSEINNIATLCLTDEQKVDYIENINEVKDAFDAVAETYDKTTESVEAVRAANKTYFGNDGNLKNSDPYQLALDESASSKKNLESYDKMIALHDAAESNLSDLLSGINQLIIGHMPGQITDDINSLKADIEIVETNADYWKEQGYCTANLEYIQNLYKEFAEKLKVVKARAISYEIEMLGKKTDEVKEQYNQVVAEHNLDYVKDYDAKIERLYTDLLINGRTDNEAKESIEWKWNNQSTSKMTYEDALNALIAHEGAVTSLLHELNGKYTNDEPAEATAAIESLLAETEIKVESIETWANYNSATETKYGKVATTLSDELSSVKEDFEAKKGTILFHEEGLTYDIDQLNKEISAVSDEIKNLYNSHVAVDEAIMSVDNMMEETANQIADVTEKIESLTYALGDIDDRMEEWADQLETINGIKGQISIGNIDEPLESCKALIDDLNTKVAYDYKEALHNDAVFVLNDMNAALDAVDAIVDASNYSAERLVKLKSGYNEIANTITSINRYNDITFNGYTVKEEGGYELIEIDYTAEAYPVVEERINDIKAAIVQLKSDAEGTSFIYGDADGNKKISVNDYSTVRRLVLDDVDFEDVEEAKRYASDMDNDEEFTVADMNQVANLIMGDATTARAMARVRSKASSNEISIVKQSEDVSIFGKTVKVAVILNNSNAFSAGQFDITLPEGMTISDNGLTERSNGHEIFVNKIGDNTYRVVVATIENNEFNGNSGDLVLLDVAVDSNVADGNIQLSNAIFADVQGRAFQLGGVDGTDATGIESINAATAKERVYSIGGQIMKTMKKGINIIVGENGETKKVVKK